MVFCNQLKYYPYIKTNWCHNPYFNRWFSAIKRYHLIDTTEYVTILILIDGFLQYKMVKMELVVFKVTILILIDGFLQ